MVIVCTKFAATLRYDCKMHRRYSRHATSEHILEVAVFEGDWSLWSKILGKRGYPLPTILRVRKLDSSIFHDVKISLVLSQFTRLTETDGQTDGRTDAHEGQRLRSCSAVIRTHFNQILPMVGPRTD